MISSKNISIVNQNDGQKTNNPSLQKQDSQSSSQISLNNQKRSLPKSAQIQKNNHISDDEENLEDDLSEEIRCQKSQKQNTENKENKDPFFKQQISNQQNNSQQFKIYNRKILQQITNDIDIIDKIKQGNEQKYDENAPFSHLSKFNYQINEEKLESKVDVREDKLSTPYDRYIFLLIMLENINQNEKSANCIKDKDIVIVLGTTGAGKSTIVTYFAGVTLQKKSRQKQLDGFKKIVQTFYIDVESEQEAVTKIGHSIGQSQTRALNTCKLKYSNGQEYILVDSPGFDDSEGKITDICNSIGIMKAFEYAKSIKIVLVINKEQFSVSGRAQSMRDLINLCSRLFTDIEKCQKSSIIVINKAEDEESQISVLSSLDELAKLAKDEKEKEFYEEYIMPCMSQDYQSIYVEPLNKEKISEFLQKIESIPSIPNLTIQECFKYIQSKESSQKLETFLTNIIDDFETYFSKFDFYKIQNILDCLNKLSEQINTEILKSINKKSFLEVEKFDKSKILKTNLDSYETDKDDQRANQVLDVLIFEMDFVVWIDLLKQTYPDQFIQIPTFNEIQDNLELTFSNINQTIINSEDYRFICSQLLKLQRFFQNKELKITISWHQQNLQKLLNPLINNETIKTKDQSYAVKNFLLKDFYQISCDFIKNKYMRMIEYIFKYSLTLESSNISEIITIFDNLQKCCIYNLKFHIQKDCDKVYDIFKQQFGGLIQNVITELNSLNFENFEQSEKKLWSIKQSYLTFLEIGKQKQFLKDHFQNLNLETVIQKAKEQMKNQCLILIKQQSTLKEIQQRKKVYQLIQLLKSIDTCISEDLKSEITNMEHDLVKMIMVIESDAKIIIADIKQQMATLPEVNSMYISGIFVDKNTKQQEDMLKSKVEQKRKNLKKNVKSLKKCIEEVYNLYWTGIDSLYCISKNIFDNLLDVISSIKKEMKSKLEEFSFFNETQGLIKIIQILREKDFTEFKEMIFLSEEKFEKLIKEIHQSIEKMITRIHFNLENDEILDIDKFIISINKNIEQTEKFGSFILQFQEILKSIIYYSNNQKQRIEDQLQDKNTDKLKLEQDKTNLQKFINSIENINDKLDNSYKAYQQKILQKNINLEKCFKGKIFDYDKDIPTNKKELEKIFKQLRTVQQYSHLMKLYGKHAYKIAQEKSCKTVQELQQQILLIFSSNELLLKQTLVEEYLNRLSQFETIYEDNLEKIEYKYENLKNQFILNKQIEDIKLRSMMAEYKFAEIAKYISQFDNLIEKRKILDSLEQPIKSLFENIEQQLQLSDNEKQKISDLKQKILIIFEIKEVFSKELIFSNLSISKKLQGIQERIKSYLKEVTAKIKSLFEKISYSSLKKWINYLFFCEENLIQFVSNQKDNQKLYSTKCRKYFARFLDNLKINIQILEGKDDLLKQIIKLSKLMPEISTKIFFQTAKVKFIEKCQKAADSFAQSMEVIDKESLRQELEKQYRDVLIQLHNESEKDADEVILKAVDLVQNQQNEFQQSLTEQNLSQYSLLLKNQKNEPQSKKSYFRKNLNRLSISKEQIYSIIKFCQML